MHSASPEQRDRTRQPRFRQAGVVRTALVVALLGLSPLTHAQDSRKTDGSQYRLGPEDKVRLKVFEWRPSQDEVFEWKALNDDFTVNAAGMLSIPLAGEIPVQGLAADEAARLIGERLRLRMNLNAPPDAAIDIVQYRPFFVSGDVVRPGPYPFRPGLSVLEAVTIAGGVLRPGDPGFMRISRDVISGEGDLIQLAQEYDALLIRRARLQAEIDGATAIKLPPELDGPRAQPQTAPVLKAETLIFQARQRAFTTQSQALKVLQAFLGKEAASLDAQLVTLDTQMGLINRELTGVSSLVEKGIVVAPRQLALERSVAQIQGDRLSMQTNKLRVQEEMSKTDLALIELTNSRTTEASIELRDTQLKLDALLSKTETSGKLLFEAKVVAPGLLADRMRESVMAPRYVIVHPTEGASNSSEVGEDAKVEPGDTIKITLPLTVRPPGLERSAEDLPRPNAE